MSETLLGQNQIGTSSSGQTLINPNQIRNWPKINVIETGNLTRNNYSYSGFVNKNTYLSLTEITQNNKYLICKDKSFFNLSSNNIEIVINVTTGSSLSGLQNIFFTTTGMTDCFVLDTKLGIWLNQSSSFMDCGTISTNTEYYVKIIIDGSTRKISYSTDGISYINEQTGAENSDFTKNNKIILGSSPDEDRAWTGSIDLSKSYIKVDGEYWWKGVETL